MQKPLQGALRQAQDDSIIAQDDSIIAQDDSIIAQDDSMNFRMTV
jgi:hypothetical protein